MCPCPSEKSVRTMLSVNFWNPVTCFAACCLIYLIGEFLSHLTKGYVPSLLFASFIFLFAFWAGVLPVDVTTSSGIVTVTANFGIALLLTNMGTMIDLETMCREWKTVLIAFLGLGLVAEPFPCKGARFWSAPRKDRAREKTGKGRTS